VFPSDHATPGTFNPYGAARPAKGNFRPHKAPRPSGSRGPRSGHR